LFVVIVAELIAADSSSPTASPPKSSPSLFRQRPVRLFVPAHRRQADRAGAPDVSRFW